MMEKCPLCGGQGEVVLMATADGHYRIFPKSIFKGDMCPLCRGSKKLDQTVVTAFALKFGASAPTGPTLQVFMEEMGIPLPGYTKTDRDLLQRRRQKQHLVY